MEAGGRRGVTDRGDTSRQRVLRAAKELGFRSKPPAHSTAENGDIIDFIPRRTEKRHESKSSSERLVNSALFPQLGHVRGGL
jgi:hypothetical protein